MSALILILVALSMVVLFTAIGLWVAFSGLSKKARAAGDPGVGAYLRAAPRNDEEKRHAVDLALKGVILVLLGLFFPPLILIGVFPLYYGSRKMCLAWMGLGILEDGDRSSA